MLRRFAVTLAGLLVVMLAGAPAAAAQSTQPADSAARFTAGIYIALPRDSTAPNDYRDIEFHFLEEGRVIWFAKGEPFQQQQWQLEGDRLDLDADEGCPTAPSASYRVRPFRAGFAFEVISDQCGQRAAAVTLMYLVPRPTP